MDLDNQNEDLTDEQIDSLVDGSEDNSAREIPMSDKDIPAAQPAADISFEFSHNGKQIKANREQMIKYASMGYDYPQKMAQFNSQKQAFENQQKEYETKYSPYREINEWAEKSPQEWQRIQQLYQDAKNQVQQPSQPAPQLQKFEQELGEVRNFMSEIKSEKQQAERASQDQALDAEMKSIQETYKDLDFDSPNNEGKSLTYQVLEYCKDNGIRSFKTGFNDFYHDKLVERAATLAKQEVSKGIQRNSKLGVLGKSPTLSKTYSEPRNLKQQSYEDLAAEALAELRAGS